MNPRQQREILREVADAFEFRVVGEEEVDGFATLVIQAEPRPGYRPRSKETKILPNFRGRLWITKDEYRWVRVDAEVVRRISIGLVLACLNPGTTVDFEQRRVNDEIWMPSQVHVRAVGRLALLKKFNAEVFVTYSDYRKFQRDSRITETMEITRQSSVEILVPRIVGHGVDVTQFLGHQRIYGLHAEGRTRGEQPPPARVRQLLHPSPGLRDQPPLLPRTPPRDAPEKAEAGGWGRPARACRPRIAAAGQTGFGSRPLVRRVRCRLSP